jgi:predicted transposase YbfD/YdcC
VRLTLDGKTLRGTIAAGQTRGLHLLAAFLPGEGWVIVQVPVDGIENEITVAPRVLQAVDLRGKIVTGDALFAQRHLSAQIVAGGGDYVWTVKDNQSQLRQDIATWFEPEPCVKGFSPTLKDFRTARTTEKAHGRLEQRRLTVSSDLTGYLDWPAAQQVFKLERHFERMKDGKITHEVVYGVTSLTAQAAGPLRLLEAVRTHWQIENGLHYRRDETLREDWCHLRVGHAPRMMAAINNLVLGLLLGRGVKNVPEARRAYAANWQEALRLIVCRPG